MRLEVNTQPLQNIAADIGLKHLKLSICHPACKGWNLAPNEEPVSITIPLHAELAATGFDASLAMTLAFVLVAAGLGLVAVSARRSI